MAKSGHAVTSHHIDVLPEGVSLRTKTLSAPVAPQTIVEVKQTQRFEDGTVAGGRTSVTMSSLTLARRSIVLLRWVDSLDNSVIVRRGTPFATDSGPVTVPITDITLSHDKTGGNGWFDFDENVAQQAFISSLVTGPVRRFTSPDVVGTRVLDAGTYNLTLSVGETGIFQNDRFGIQFGFEIVPIE